MSVDISKRPPEAEVRGSNPFGRANNLLLIRDFFNTPDKVRMPIVSFGAYLAQITTRRHKRKPAKGM